MDVMSTVQKAFVVAQELRTDPFAIKRPMPDTPEAVTPVFRPHQLSRAALTARAILGYGQAWALCDYAAHIDAVRQSVSG